MNTLTQNKQLNILLRGGLGNQLFIYNYAEYIRQTVGVKIKLLHLTQPGDFFGIVSNDREFETFMRITGVTPELIKSTSEFKNPLYLDNHPYEFIKFNYDNFDYDNTLICGYFQCGGYGINLKRYFKASNDELAVHVRGGDYLKLQAMGFYNLQQTNYYRNSIQFMVQNFKLQHNQIKIYCENESDIIDPFLRQFSVRILPAYDTFAAIAQSKYKIIANSTYSYWAAMLSDGGISSIAPSIWIRESTIYNLFNEGLTVMEVKQ